jgi:hypothetical protein
MTASKVLKVLNFRGPRGRVSLPPTAAVLSVLRSTCHSESQRGISSFHVPGDETISVCGYSLDLVDRFQKFLITESRGDALAGVARLNQVVDDPGLDEHGPTSQAAPEVRRDLAARGTGRRPDRRSSRSG